MTQEQTSVPLTPAQGCIAILYVWFLWLAALTPLIAVAWNVGLENAGIVPNEIDWLTALGLAVALMLLRSIIAAGRRV